MVPRGSGVETKPLLLGSTGAESFVSGVSTFPVGAALKTHKHNTEEMVVLLEGEATVEAGARPPCGSSGCTEPRTSRGPSRTRARRWSTCPRATRAASGNRIRLLKKAHLRRWFASALAATYLPSTSGPSSLGTPAYGKPPCIWIFLSSLREIEVSASA